jgi:hypothetical protein
MASAPDVRVVRSRARRGILVSAQDETIEYR